MARYPKNIHAIYISERMQENLRHIRECALTTIVAPMGYGKTTAALWYLEQRQRLGDPVFRVNIDSADVELFWQSFCAAFRGTELGRQLAGTEFPQSQAARNLLLQDLADYLARLKGELFVLLDDCHLMEDSRVFDLLVCLCGIPGEKLHLIMASRSAMFLRGEELRLGRRLYKITADDLRLNRTELSAYLRRCGVELPEPELEALFRNSEGWFSCVYLNLRNYEKSGSLLSRTGDIYAMIGQTLYAGYGQPEREFLLAMCIADEFTAEQAEFITEDPGTAGILGALVHNNAFIRYLPDTGTYRFHHMLRGYVEQRFAGLPPQRRRELKLRYGLWHEAQGQYNQALRFFSEAGDIAAILRTIGRDRGVQLASMEHGAFLQLLERFPEEALLADPLALLVLMRQLFSRKEIPRMMAMKALFLRAVEQPGISARERDDLLGESDLIQSFLCYNDIEAMSALHRKAAARMHRKAISTGNTGSYTFGSPSVLMMFHREAGALTREVQTMNQAMPYYYQITDRSGVGAEVIMEAEAYYARGEFTDARIMLRRAKIATGSTSQLHLPLCCEFLEQRLALFGQAPRCEDWYARKSADYRKAHDPMIFSTLDGCQAYLAAVALAPEGIPGWLAEGKLSQNHLLNPARPMFGIIHNQVLLAQQDFIAVLARSRELMAMCRSFPYLLCQIHVHIQLAIASHALGKAADARQQLQQALELALPDGIVMPFAENLLLSQALLAECCQYPQVKEILRLQALLRRHICGGEGAVELLTRRERDIAALYAAGKTRRQIAGELYLSEGTVKNYISAIYEKLQLSGTPKQKQHALARLMDKKT